MRNDLPSGTVTFLFTDVEGSTKLLRELGAEEYAEALAEHRRVIREACATEGGVEVDTQGDAFFFAFHTAPGALAAAEAMTEALAPGPIQVRVGLHTGTALVAAEGYVGDDVHRAARIAAAGHGGQVLVSSATGQLVELELTDLGEHRLKDIAEVVPIYQLGNDSFSPLKTISNTNLPTPASSFVGRDDELLELLSRIEEGARLLTLTGPGGTGKTRLAIEAAATLVPEYKAGVFWVGLATLRDSALVTETIGQTLGASDGLAEHIGEREMLLLLDNVEQVVDCAPELSELLTACSELTLLVTSRELLRIQGEVEYVVPPLAESEAVSLFCERAQLEPSAEITELCTRLDSLPLAVELAAARAKVLSPAQILERLSGRLDLLKGGRDADPRQQTLRATIEWSYELLSPEEQQLFACLSVFAGGCTLEAAEEVCDADLDTLQSLVEKSLLRLTAGRYWMLETIREYAYALISADRDLQRLHAAHFAEIAEQEGGRFRTAAQLAAVRALGQEKDNIRSALAFLASIDPERLQQMVSSLRLYWTVAGASAETKDWAERALATARTEDSEYRADTLLFLAGAHYRAANTSEGLAHAEEAVRMYSRLKSDGLAQALEYLANAHALEGDYPAAIDAYREAVSEATRIGDDHRKASATGNLGYAMLRQGDYARALGIFLEVAELERGLGQEAGAAVAVTNAALAALLLHRLDKAHELFSEAVVSSSGLGHAGLLACCLEGFAALAVSAGAYERAARLQGAAARQLSAAGAVLDPVEQSIHERTRVAIDSAVGPDALQAFDSGLSLDAAQSVDYALASID